MDWSRPFQSAHYEHAPEAYATTLRHDNLGVSTLDTRDDDGGDIDYWVYRAFGTTPDPAAVAVLRELYDDFGGANTNFDRIFDIILEMPPGYKTSPMINRVLQSFPMGLMARKLRNRCIARFGTDRAFHQLVYSGMVYRIRNTPAQSATPVPNQYRGRFGEDYYPTHVAKDVDNFEMYQFPLHKIQFSMPPPSTEEIPGLDRCFIVNTSEETPVLAIGPEPVFTTENYVNLVTNLPTGSDISFFLYSDTGCIIKRYHDIDTPGVTPMPIIRARPIRSAGLKQVLLKDHVGEFFCRDDTCYAHVKFFVPGGSRNCFLGSIRWCYLQHERDKYLKESSSLMDLAQDSDMLMTASPPTFDEDLVLKKIDEMIASIIKHRANMDHHSDINSYTKKYRNGFPTVEMNQIASLFYLKFGIMIYYWRIISDGKKWKNVISFSNLEPIREDVIHITMIQMSDTGVMLDLGAEKEKETEASEVDNVSMGLMTHAIGIFPPLSYLKTLNGKFQRQRRVFREELDKHLKPYIESVYKILDYNADITGEYLRELVNHQAHRYRMKETKTLIFNLETYSSHLDKKIKYGGGSSSSSEYGSSYSKYIHMLNNREFPKIFVFAYDLETVDNLPYLQNRVYPPFRKGSDDPIFRACYEPQACQIPFSAQYIGVNVDDEGQFLEMKLQKDIKPLKYPNQNYGKYHDVFLTPRAVTNYGTDNFLGSCVESFLCDIAKYVNGFQSEQAYIFACNGSKFDAFVILQFQRFEITHILKTARGILSVSLRVPIVCPDASLDYDYRTDSNPKVTIKLRDVSLLVPGSLARLCKGFDVPKEFVKLDFPIQMINGENCYHPEVMKICKQYGENDVYSLGYVLKCINRLIGNSHWKPCDVNTERPPICQFVTCMGMIRKSTKQHFDSILPQSLQPKAVDIPALRTWIINAAIGGRVTAYAKTYASNYANDILNAAAQRNTEELKMLYDLMVSKKSCMRCLDFTSLYPFVMDSCPLPMSACYYIDQMTCNDYINRMHCEDCDRLRRLCQKHRHYYQTNDDSMHERPFAIILVKNLKLNPLNDYRNLCPRKTYNANTKKGLGIVYSLENQKDFEERMQGKENLRDPQSFTNVDLYWMRRQGYSFDIIGGISWHVMMVYNTFIGPAFQMRIEAKKAGNKLLSDFMKLNYNGSYGITIQQDITESFFMTRLPEKFKDCDPRGLEVRNEIYSVTRSRKSGDGISCSEELTGEGFYLPNGQSCFQKKKKDHLAEYYSEQSPLQVGAAILSYARHVGNLILFNVDPRHYTYTDTDSIAISDHVIENDPHLLECVIDRDDAPMGSLKNDHAENNGTEPRIFLSLIGAKKVKCHLTLNQEGEVRIFNTFKGLNVSCDLNGLKVDPAYAEYITTKVLFDLNQKSRTEPVTVQSWKRDLQHGVSIGNHMQIFDTNTYLSDHKGLAYFTHESGQVEYLIPHGMDDSFCDVKVVTGKDQEKEYDKPRKQLYDPQYFKEFLKVYYSGCDQEYNPGTEEYQKILDLFKSIKE